MITATPLFKPNQSALTSKQDINPSPKQVSFTATAQEDAFIKQSAKELAHNPTFVEALLNELGGNESFLEKLAQKAASKLQKKEDSIPLHVKREKLNELNGKTLRATGDQSYSVCQLSFKAMAELLVPEKADINAEDHAITWMSCVIEELNNVGRNDIAQEIVQTSEDYIGKDHPFTNAMRNLATNRW